MKLDVLLTDGDYKNTYAILRSLKSQNLKVGVLIHKYSSITYFSRLVDKRFIINSRLVKNPSPDIFSKYFHELEKIFKENEINVFLPVSNISYKFASLYKKEIEKYCKVPVVINETMEIAQDKSKTFEHAEKNGIPIPQTFHFNNEEDVYKIIEKIKFPCVLKKTNYNESGVVYCNNKEEFINAFKDIVKNRKKGSSFPVAQEYIVGPGTGFYGIYNNGKCAGFFMHERIHEFPITGGASTLAKSVFEKDLMETGDKLLSSLNWHGVAMVEFKRDSRDGQLKLMEINPKFWGSYELSFTAGINFAYLAYLVALEKNIPDTTYDNDIYFRWTLPHDIIWYKHASSQQRKDYKKLKKQVKIHSNIHWDDPLPVLFNLMFTVYKLFREKKYPHGYIK
jgi:predicted ATP-grasp superfamily ATP-dependent carboligase